MGRALRRRSRAPRGLAPRCEAGRSLSAAQRSAPTVAPASAEQLADDAGHPGDGRRQRGVTMEPGLLEHLPPAWLALIHEWAPYALGVVVLTTAAAHLLLPLARKFEAWALTTSVEWDNRLASLVIVALGWIVATSATLLEWLPRFVMGPGDTKPTKVHRAGTLIEPSTPPPPAPPDPPVGGAGLALVLVIVAAALSVASSGCSSGPQTAGTGAATSPSCAWTFTAGGESPADGGATLQLCHDCTIERVE